MAAGASFAHSRKRRTRQRIIRLDIMRWFAVGGVLSLMMTGCGGTGRGTIVGAIYGIGTANPTLPNAGCFGTRCPARDATAEVLTSKGRLVTTIAAGSHGQFRLAILPGVYRIRLSRGFICSPTRIVVNADRLHRVTLECGGGWTSSVHRPRA
jgi:hypothetical protein